MNPWVNCYAPLFGRILMGGYFLLNGTYLALNFTDAVVGLGLIVGIPNPDLILFLNALIVLVLSLGGIALVVGYRTRTAALVMAVVTILLGYLRSDFTDSQSIALLTADMAIVGGLLYISAFGSGVWAFHGRRS